MSDRREPVVMEKAKTIDGKDVTAWVHPDGFYVLLSLGHGERTFVLGGADADHLAANLAACSRLAKRLMDERERHDELHDGLCASDQCHSCDRIRKIRGLPLLGKERA